MSYCCFLLYLPHSNLRPATHSRTCEECGALDGKIFPVTEAKVGVNYPPLHPNDRCTTVTAMSNEELSNLQRRARDPDTGETKLVPASMTYEEWKAENIDPETDKLKKTGGKSFHSAEDKSQFERYKAVLKENAPQTLDDFLKIKYNNFGNQYKIDSGNFSAA